MSLVQEIQDGKYVSDKTSSTSTTSKSKTDSTKEMFLQLLVTEMQYQDPLQPTDNSEYVKEMATFSQVEALNSVSDKMNELQASALVGNYVTVTDDDGNTANGFVEYVTTDSDDILISIDGKTYSVDNITSVQDSSYYEAGVLASAFSSAIAKLPSVSDVTSQNATDIANARAYYNALSDYQKTFINQSDLAKLTALETKLNPSSTKTDSTNNTTNNTTNSTTDSAANTTTTDTSTTTE